MTNHEAHDRTRAATLAKNAPVFGTCDTEPRESFVLAGCSIIQHSRSREDDVRDDFIADSCFTHTMVGVHLFALFLCSESLASELALERLFLQHVRGQAAAAGGVTCECSLRTVISYPCDPKPRLRAAPTTFLFNHPMPIAAMNASGSPCIMLRTQVYGE